MQVRRATLADAAAVGQLHCTSLSMAPSSPVGRGDLPVDPLDAGREHIEPPIARGEIALVLEFSEQIAGIAVVRARELVRAHHVGDLTVLVHPLARGRGGGRQLVSAVIDAATPATWPHKLTVRVAADDEPLRRTLVSTGAPWVRERVEHGALRRGTALFDVERWGLVLDA